MFSLITKLIVPIILCVIGILTLKDSFSAEHAQKVKAMEQLVKEGQQAMAIVDSSYTEKTIRRKRSSYKVYEFGYTFDVDGKSYRGTKTQDTPPDAPIIKVTYLPSDPNVNSTDAEGDLKSAKDSFPMYAGIGALVVGLVLGFFRYRSFKQTQG